MTASDGSTAADILNAALGHMQDRAATYDKPEGERSMGATVDAFTAVTGVFMTEEQGWLFMALLKAVRSQQGAYRADSYEDGAAYFALAGEAAVRDRNGNTGQVIDPADVEISEQSDKCKGCFAGCRDCRPGFAKLQDEKLARMRADSAERFVSECVGFLSEPASAIDDDSERMQAIGQNGEMADEVYAAVDQSTWANCELESLTSEARKYARDDMNGFFWSDRGRKFNMNRWRVLRWIK